MPVYDVSAVAHALDLELKQLDNLLSRNVLAGVEKKRRGLARRLTPDVAVVIRLAKELSEALGVSTGSMLPIAHDIERSSAEDVQLSEFLTLHVDRNALRASTLARLDSAVEVIGTRRRGRPPRRDRADRQESL